MALPDLIEINDLLLALGKDPAVMDEQEVDKFNFAIKAASQSVRNYVGRTFEVTTGDVTARTFLYDNSGFLDVDDCVSISAVTGEHGSVARALLGDEWLPQPYGGMPVYEWVQVIGGAFGLGSPEMGFTRNLDKLYQELPGRPILMTVEAEWGWPEVPADVQQAVVWVTANLVEDPGAHQSESIEGYSWSNGPLSLSQTIPDRAMTALTPYEKLKV